MRCHEINNMLSAYLDGALEPSEILKLEEHLKRCQQCRQEYEDLKSVLDLVQGLPEVQPPANFRSELRRHLEVLPVPQEKGEKTPGVLVSLARGRWSKVVAAAAALVLTVGLTALWYGDVNRPGSGADPGVRQFLPVQDRAVVGESKSPLTKSEDYKVNHQEITLDARIEENIKENDVKNNIVKDNAKKDSKNVSGVLSKKVLKQQPAEGAADLIPATEPLKVRQFDVSRKKVIQPKTVPVPGSVGAAMSLPAPGSYGIASEQQRKYIKQADLSIDVSDTEQTAGKIKSMAREYGGEALEGSERGQSYLTVRLPVSGYQDFLGLLKAQGTVVNENLKDRDITDQYNEVQVSLMNLQAEEQRLLSISGRTAANNSDNTVNEELARIRGMIKQKQEQLKSLEYEAGFATISINLK